jgi:hypothetical protein
MADLVRLPGTDAEAKVRSPVLVVVWSLLTLGIYGLVWYYKVNKELAELGRAKGTEELGTSPGTSLLAVTLGALVIVPAIISMINTYKRITAAQRMAGVSQPLNGWIAIILAFVLGPVLYAYLQSGQNATLKLVGQVEGAPAPALAG